MDVKIVTHDVTPQHWNLTGGLAPEQDVSIGHLMRRLLTREVDRYTEPTPQKRAEGRLLSALRALLEADMALAHSWGDLTERLADQGYALRHAGGGLALHKEPCGTRLCTASELGFAYRKLVKRFEGPMPGHPRGVPEPVGAALKGRISAAPYPQAS